MSIKEKQKWPTGWHLRSNALDDFDVEVVDSERIAGAKSLSITSRSTTELGDFSQSCGVDKYLGRRVRMTAWVQSDLADGNTQLYLRIDGTWRTYYRENGTFDNMWPDRIITGKTDWRQYALVVDVPPGSASMHFGIYVSGHGRVLLESVAFEVVDESITLTGITDKHNPEPINLDFSS